MKILFFGGKGWIGSILVGAWKQSHPSDVIALSETRINHENVKTLEEEIQKVDRVVSTIGRTSGVACGVFVNNIDYLEYPGNLKDNIRDNIYGPVLLSILCNKHNKHFTYLGTGCIFSRDTNNNDYVYTENDTPDFFGSSYSVVKGYTDTLMKSFNNVLNLRIRMPIVDGVHSKSFVTKIIGYKKICNFRNSMTYLPNIVSIIVHMSRKGELGTYNMVNGAMSHKEILEEYKKYNKNATYEYVEENNLNLKSKRSNNILSNEKLRKYCARNNLTLKNIEDCMNEVLRNHAVV
jgi:3,5-epimerase/4-reductase